MLASLSRSQETKFVLPPGTSRAGPNGPMRDEHDDGILVSRASPHSASAVRDAAPSLGERSRDEDQDDMKQILLSAGLRGGSTPLLPQGKVYRIPVGTALSFATNGSGLINTVIQNGPQLVTLARFTALSGIFDEFFVNKVVVRYRPYNRYQIQPGTTGTQRTSVSMNWASLQHDAVPYSVPADMVVNPTYHVSTTDQDVDFTWRNVERHSDSTVVVPDRATPAFTQSWCLTGTANASLYTGQVQVLGPAGTPMASATTIGAIAVHWDILWRCRR